MACGGALARRSPCSTTSTTSTCSANRPLIVLAVLSFGAVAVAQALFPLWSGHPAALGLRVHLANGLYTNAVFDRLTGGWLYRPAKS